jgi:hypothetical protein
MHTFEFESSFKNNYKRLIFLLLVGIVAGPILIYLIIWTAISNNVTDYVSWGIIIIFSLIIFYLTAYSEFKYVWRTRFNKTYFDVNEKNNTIKVLPDREIILIGEVQEFVYNNKLKSYIFRNSNRTAKSFEVMRNLDFENLLSRFSLECKIE